MCFQHLYDLCYNLNQREVHYVAMLSGGLRSRSRSDRGNERYIRMTCQKKNKKEKEKVKDKQPPEEIKNHWRIKEDGMCREIVT